MQRLIANTNMCTATIGNLTLAEHKINLCAFKKKLFGKQLGKFILLCFGWQNLITCVDYYKRSDLQLKQNWIH